ncbi:MAG: ribonuclease P protein component [Candidatus Gribaldobacteria bacterium]|nr:ribonuclease P protein component [Candidatus Gribaldobacteria bacterium]
MLSKENRLKKKNDFARVMAGRGTVGGPWLVLRFTENQLPLSRAGFVCSKKTAKRAVDRNKIKRQLRESMRRIWPQIATGYDLVLIVRGPLIGKPFDEMQAVLEKLLKKARLL